jgi:fructose-1,6-bisphosphatase II
MNIHMKRNLGLDLARASEAAAIAAGRFAGAGKKVEADLAATDVMLAVLKTIDMDGEIVVGDEARLGEQAAVRSGVKVGTGSGQPVDVVLDPVDGRELVACGLPGAISAVAAAPRGSIWKPGPAAYMEKIVVDARVAPALVPECLTAPAAWTLALVARALHKPVNELRVFVLDRPRHADLIKEIRAAGARVLLHAQGDIAGALLAATRGSKVDLLMGTGGMTEGLIAACAVRALNGGMLGRLSPQSPEERAAVAAAGCDLKRTLTAQELVSSDDVFFAATGITGGELLEAVTYEEQLLHVNSLILRGETHARRLVFADHEPDVQAAWLNHATID